MRLLKLNSFVQKKIIWNEDIKTRLLVGDINTPAEAIAQGRDDCRGQAVVTVSVLIGLGYNAYVVEMPWHWWTMVYNGTDAYPVNQFGHLKRIT